MPVPLKYSHVNWVNGMKIRKEHFVQQENALDDCLKDAIACSLNSFNYGLLPVSGTRETSFKIVMKVSNQKFLNITVFQLRAVTEGGARIEIMENQFREFTLDLSNEIETSKKEDSGEHLVMMSVDPFTKEPFGQIKEDEEPPRYPFAAPSLKLNVLPEKQIARDGINPFSLIVGKLNIRPDKIEIFEDYIPASMTLKSHNRLMNFHSSVEKFYNQLEINLLSIISKIKEKGQDSSLALSVLSLALNLLNFISGNNLKIRWQLVNMPPLLLFENIASFARIIRNTVDCNTSVQKEELLNYFTNWSELKQGDFEKLLTYCINFNYDHNEISVNVDQFSEFVQIMASLFSKLESLAYIGKKKETNIFVKEQTAKRSFLAD